MDKRKPRRSQVVVDELGLAKAAAWAWYERGSGSEGRSIREIDAGRTKTDRRPSRYKLEASRNVQPDQRATLLDSYEIERISMHLQHYIESTRAKHHGGAAAAAAEEKNKKRILTRGSWLIRRGGPLCGASRNDVVELPEKGRVRPPVADVVSLRPG